MDFFNTKRGCQFIDCDIPRISKSLEKLARVLEGGDNSNSVRTHSIVVEANILADMELNKFISEKAKKVVDIKVNIYEVNGNVKKEYLILYVPKNGNPVSSLDNNII